MGPHLEPVSALFFLPFSVSMTDLSFACDMVECEEKVVTISHVDKCIAPKGNDHQD